MDMETATKMKVQNRKQMIPYIGIPVLAALLFALRRESEKPIILLLYEVLLVFGYVAAVGDLREMRVSNRLVGALFCAWVLVMVPQLYLQTETATVVLISGFVGAVLCGILMLVVYMVSRKGLGGGDVKFMTVSGLYLGAANVLPAMLYGAILAAAVGLGLVLLKKIGMRDAIPLAPFLYAGMLIVMFI